MRGPQGHQQAGDRAIVTTCTLRMPLPLAMNAFSAAGNGRGILFFRKKFKGKRFEGMPRKGVGGDRGVAEL